MEVLLEITNLFRSHFRRFNLRSGQSDFRPVHRIYRRYAGRRCNAHRGRFEAYVIAVIWIALPFGPAQEENALIRTELLIQN